MPKSLEWVAPLAYSSRDNQSVTYYDSNWTKNSYFISSSETAFEMKVLQTFDAELFLGHNSYNQKAEIYTVAMDSQWLLRHIQHRRRRNAIQVCTVQLNKIYTPSVNTHVIVYTIL